VHQDRTKSRGLDQPSDFRRHYTIAIKIFPALHQKSFRSCDMRHRLAVRSRVVMPPRGIKSCPAFPHNLEPRFAQRGSFFLGSVTTWDRFLQSGTSLQQSAQRSQPGDSMAIGLPVAIAAGLLSDRFGRKPLLIATCVLGFVGAVPLFWLLNQPSALFAQFGQLGLMLIIGLYGGTLPAVLVEAAPPQVRCTAVSLGYNISFGVIGGLTPLVAAWLVERTGDEIAPAFLIMASVVVTTVTLTRFRETYRAPLAGVTSNAAPAYT
jgi:MFS family permease